MTKETKNKIFNKFSIFMFVYIGIFIIFILLSLNYVKQSLEMYEKSQVQNFLIKVIENIQNKNYDIDVSKEKISTYENKDFDIRDVIVEYMKEKDITYEIYDEKNNEKPIYALKADDENFLLIYLDGTNIQTKLGIMTFSNWEVEKLELKTTKGLYYYDIFAPNDANVYINDTKILKESAAEIIDFEDAKLQLNKFTTIPYQIKYEINNLLLKPDIKILDENNKEYKKTIEEHKINTELNIEYIEEYENAIQKISPTANPLDIAHKWSLYLTKDLQGYTNGYGTIQRYLAPDSDILTFARNWASGMDITFIGPHKLEDPPFINEKVSNFEIYNEEAFSCEIYFEKPIHINTEWSTKVDIFHERMYFYYFKDLQSWRLVSMQAIVDSE
ncbi:MAG: hypothetical protein Q4F88_03850 [Eubacteriales bacterium]|nr:hypothetical protein [Eubacteriales bacterium]